MALPPHDPKWKVASDHVAYTPQGSGAQEITREFGQLMEKFWAGIQRTVMPHVTQIMAKAAKNGDMSLDGTPEEAAKMLVAAAFHGVGPGNLYNERALNEVLSPGGGIVNDHGFIKDLTPYLAKYVQEIVDKFNGMGPHTREIQTRMKIVGPGEVRAELKGGIRIAEVALEKYATEKLNAWARQKGLKNPPEVNCNRYEGREASLWVRITG